MHTRTANRILRKVNPKLSLEKSFSNIRSSTLKTDKFLKYFNNPATYISYFDNSIKWSVIEDEFPYFYNLVENNILFQTTFYNFVEPYILSNYPNKEDKIRFVNRFINEDAVKKFFDDLVKHHSCQNNSIIDFTFDVEKNKIEFKYRIDNGKSSYTFKFSFDESADINVTFDSYRPNKDKPGYDSFVGDKCLFFKDESNFEDIIKTILFKQEFFLSLKEEGSNFYVNFKEAEQLSSILEY